MASKAGLTTILIVIIIVGGLLAISGAYYIARGDIYNGGWESQNSLYEISVNSDGFNPLGARPAGATSWGAAYCKFDADGAGSRTGVPDLTIQLTSPREYIISGGEWVVAPRGSVFDTVNKKVTVGGVDYNYFWDHHVFFFEVKMLAQADGYQVLLAADGEARGMNFAETAKISVMTSFEVDPWVNKIKQAFSTDEADYRLDEDTVWSGVMSVSVAAIEAGYVGHIGEVGYSPPSPGLVVADQTGKVNMFTPEGSEADGSDFPSTPQRSSLPDVPEKVIFELSSELSPGWEWPLFGSISTEAVKTDYKVRVDVLTTAGYRIEDGEQEDESIDEVIIDESADPIGDFIGAVGSWVDGVFTGLGGFALGFIMPIVIVIAVAVILFFVMRIIALRRGKPV
jgi:hypothetical protein